MKKAESNKEFFLDFIRELNKERKREDKLGHYIDDPILLKTLVLLEENLPNFKIIIDELTSEKNRLIVQARVEGISFPNKDKVSIAFVMGCQIHGKKIVRHWFLADNISLMQKVNQLNNV